MRYQVTCIHPTQGFLRLAVDAPDESGARELAVRQGLTVVTARAARAIAPRRRWAARRFPLMLFTQELLSLVSAGLSLPETLDALAHEDTESDHVAVIEALRRSLFEGEPMSKALERFPQHFPPLYIAMVRSGERTGDLAPALSRFIDYQSRVDAVRKKLVSASIYPVVLLVVGGLVTLFLLVYVVPRFAGIYTDADRDLPWLSMLLLEWGELLNAHATAVAVGAAGVMAAIAVLFRSITAPAARLLARVPSIAHRALVYQLARFYRTVGMLLAGGIPLPQALEMSSGLLATVNRERLARAVRRIREGSAVSVALDAEGLATPVAVRMLRVAERGGNLAEMTERIAFFYDDDIARWLDWFAKLVEPVLMAVIGLVIGTVVVLMYLPVFQLAGAVQ
jgi:general secretion pathway protein F